MKYTCSCGAEYDLAGLHPDQRYQCQCGKYISRPASKPAGKILPVILMVLSGLLMFSGLTLAIVIGSMMEQPRYKADEIYFLVDIGFLLASVLFFVLGAILAALCNISLQLRRR